MKKAAIVTVYNHPEYLNQFIEQLLRDGTTDVYLHIDKKQEGLKDKIIQREKVFFIRNNVSVSWGGYSFLQALVNSWREVLNSGHYDWIILCSGQDILLRNDLDAFLETHPGEVFIDSFEDDKRRRDYLLNKWPSCYLQLLDKKYHPLKIMRRARLEMLKRGWPFYKRKISWNTDDMVFYKNYWWSVIPEEVLRWIVEYLDKNPEYFEVFKGLIAEEGFITTTIMLSPYKERIKFDEKGRSHSLTYIRRTVNSHPLPLNADDIENAEKSDWFFARKVVPGESDDFIAHFRNRFYGED